MYFISLLILSVLLPVCLSAPVEQHRVLRLQPVPRNFLDWPALARKRVLASMAHEETVPTVCQKNFLFKKMTNVVTFFPWLWNKSMCHKGWVLLFLNRIIFSLNSLYNLDKLRLFWTIHVVDYKVPKPRCLNPLIYMSLIFIIGPD